MGTPPLPGLDSPFGTEISFLGISKQFLRNRFSSLDRSIQAVLQYLKDLVHPQLREKVGKYSEKQES